MAKVKATITFIVDTGEDTIEQAVEYLKGSGGAYELMEWASESDDMVYTLEAVKDSEG